MKKLSLFIIYLVILAGQTSRAFPQSQTITIIELNNADEYVLIKNEGETSIDLKGWVLHDHDYGKANVYSYKFGKMTLQPNEILQMQSGKKPEEQSDSKKLDRAHHYIHWANRNVWNNGCDIAYLVDDKGKVITQKFDGTDEKKKKEHCK